MVIRMMGDDEAGDASEDEHEGGDDGYADECEHEKADDDRDGDEGSD